MLASATRLGPYEIVAPIGAGGMGEVYRARDTRLDRVVALKLLPAALTLDPDRIRRFIQEAKAVSALNHPNIVTIHEFGHCDAGQFIVMELVQGRTLRQLDQPCAFELLLGGPLLVPASSVPWTRRAANIFAVSALDEGSIALRV